MKSIAQIILEQKLATFAELTPGDNLFLGYVPSAPAQLVSVIDTGGYGREFTLDNQVYYTNPTFQVRVRWVDYQTGFDLAQRIIDALQGVNNWIVEGLKVALIKSIDEPVHLGYDEQIRANNWTINFEVNITTI